MKVIFLDIDGVLNNKESTDQIDKWMEDEEYTYYNPIFNNNAWHPSCVAQLIRIVKETGAKIVLSSSWRMFYEHACHCLAACCMSSISEGPSNTLAPIDKTPIHGRDVRLSHLRGSEIQAWLDNQQGIEAYVIIDDAGDMTFLDCQQKYFVQTDGRFGLTKKNADEAIEILNGEAHPPR